MQGRAGEQPPLVWGVGGGLRSLQAEVPRWTLRPAAFLPARQTWGGMP